MSDENFFGLTSETIAKIKKERFNLLKKTITWVNETFTPLGMKPIEDFPQARVCNSHECVIARAVHLGFKGKFLATTVGYRNITLTVHPNTDKQKNAMERYASEKEWDEQLNNIIVNVPADISKFVEDFDDRKYPDLIDDEFQRIVQPDGDKYFNGDSNPITY